MRVTGKTKQNILYTAIITALLFLFGASTLTATAATGTPYTIRTINAVSFTTAAGVNPAANSITLSDSSPIDPTYTVSSNQSWLSATVSAVDVPGVGYVIPVKVNASGLAAGTYSGIVTVTIPDQSGYTWTNSPYAVPVTLTVTSGTVAPTITSQPVSQTIASGQTATFNVAATGTSPMSYQWRNGSTAISGATSSSYTTPPETSGATFSVTVSNSAGSVTSNTASLTISSSTGTPYVIRAINPLTFTTAVGANPAAQSIKLSDSSPIDPTYTVSSNQSWLSATVSTVNSGSGFVIPVKVNASGLAAGTYNGSLIITIPNQSGYTWTNSPYAVPVTLTVTSGTAVAPSITTQPASQTIVSGKTATFNVAATGTAPMTYQWSNGTAPISGATSSSYTTPAETAGATFSVTVSNSAGSVTSNPATLTISSGTLILNSSSSALNFGNVDVSSSSSQNVTLTNAGTSTVTVSGVSMSGAGFSASGVPTGLMLNAGQTATLTATFSPSGAGSVAGSVKVASNASNSPDTITLSGTGMSVATHSAALSWTASASSVVGYNTYSGTKSGGPYTKLGSTAGTSYSDSTVQSGQTYYYVVTSVDSSNNESIYSGEVVATIP